MLHHKLACETTTLFLIGSINDRIFILTNRQVVLMGLNFGLGFHDENQILTGLHPDKFSSVWSVKALTFFLMLSTRHIIRIFTDLDKFMYYCLLYV